MTTQRKINSKIARFKRAAQNEQQQPDRIIQQSAGSSGGGVGGSARAEVLFVGSSDLQCKLVDTNNNYIGDQITVYGIRGENFTTTTAGIIPIISTGDYIPVFEFSGRWYLNSPFLNVYFVEY